MRSRYLPLLSLLAACAGGAAVSESSPVPATDVATATAIGYAAADPLECAQRFLSARYQREGGSVQAGFLRFNTFRGRGGLFKLPYNATLLTVTRTDGVLRVEGRFNDERTLHDLRTECRTSVTVAPPSTRTE